LYIRYNRLMFKFFFFIYFISFLKTLPGGLSAWEGKLDEVEDSDVAEVGECLRDGSVVVLESQFAMVEDKVRVATG